MLPASARMTRRAEFTAVARRGRRAGRGLVVVLALAGQPGPARVGFVAGRGVGGAVVRNRVLRRLRHLVRARLDTLSPGTWLVIRALPATAGADFARLGADLDRALHRALGRAGAAATVR